MSRGIRCLPSLSGRISKSQTGENFVIDIIVGWVYAAAIVYFGNRLVSRWEVRRNHEHPPEAMIVLVVVAYRDEILGAGSDRMAGSSHRKVRE